MKGYGKDDSKSFVAEHQTLAKRRRRMLNRQLDNNLTMLRGKDPDVFRDYLVYGGDVSRLMSHRYGH